MRVLCVGVATLDVINTVAHYPSEDEEVRVLSQRRTRGGNATNTLVLLSQHGHSCSWAGVLPLEPDAEKVLAELDCYQIRTDFCVRPKGGKLPTSYINVSQATGSRTIVHYRDMPEYSFRAFDRIDLSQFDWIHFEGRAVTQLTPMLEKTAAWPGLRCSLEIEKPRKGIEQLCPTADVVMFSRQYVVSRGYDQAKTFLQQTGSEVNEQYLAWGDQGAWARSQSGHIYYSPAFPPEIVCDTVGAGDVFNAGIIHARMENRPISEAVIYACRLAGAKCGLEGFAGVLPMGVIGPQ